MHASVRAFRDSALALGSSAEIKDGTYAFGLIALGKFMLRLPAEVLEDELPRLKATLIAVSLRAQITCCAVLFRLNTN